MAARARIRSFLPSSGTRTTFGLRPFSPAIPILGRSIGDRLAHSAVAQRKEEHCSSGVVQNLPKQAGDSSEETISTPESLAPLDPATVALFTKVIRRLEETGNLTLALSEQPHDAFAEFAAFSTKLIDDDARVIGDERGDDFPRSLIYSMEIDALGETAAKSLIDILDIAASEGDAFTAFPIPTLAAVFHTLSGSTLYPPSLKLSLSLLDALQRVRHPRSREIYATLMNHCMAWQRPDWAAAVFVGLVEEWVMEGRVAEGAVWDDHREGGGPKRSAVTISQLMAIAQAEVVPVGGAENSEWLWKRQAMASRWFHGVRTTRFMGETLSPLDRLGLWHPKNLALPKKLRGFPMPLPTSPPTLVPAPDIGLLNIILRGLDLTPPQPSAVKEGKEPTYDRSVIALAMIANTILSRTLPIPVIPSLLKAFQAVPKYPPVFPRPLTPEESQSPQAYTAYSQIRHALVSLFLSPPNTVTGFAQMYKLPPLGLDACSTLINIAFRNFRQPEMVKGLFDYMSKGRLLVGNLAVGMYNTVLRVASLSKMNDVADSAAGILLGRTKLANQAKIGPTAKGAIAESTSTPLDPAVAASLALQTSKSLTATSSSGSFIDLHLPDPESPLQPDSITLTTLLAHYTSTSQHHEIVKLASALFTNIATATPTQTERLLARSRALAPEVYVALLNGLAKAGEIRMVRRLWTLAKDAEGFSRLANGQGKEAGAGKVGREPWWLPIQAYTVMLQVFDDRIRWNLSKGLGGVAIRKKNGANATSTDVSKSKNWTPKQALNAAYALYDSVIMQSRSQLFTAKPPASPLPSFLQPSFNTDYSRPPAPDARFFNAYLSILSHAIDPPNPSTPLAALPTMLEKDLMRLTQLLADMTHVGITPPMVWRRRQEMVRMMLERARGLLGEEQGHGVDVKRNAGRKWKNEVEGWVQEWEEMGEREKGAWLVKVEMTKSLWRMDGNVD